MGLDGLLRRRAASQPPRQLPQLRYPPGDRICVRILTGSGIPFLRISYEMLACGYFQVAVGQSQHCQ